ncbi:MAG: hypothetical protein IJW86_06655 [Clostridia bacterium]|nr:hypothetical protein [Clostridia bacterium]
MKKILIALSVAAIVCFVCLTASAKYIKDTASSGASLEVGSTASAVPPQETPEEKTLPQVQNLTFVKSLRGAVSLSWDKVEGAYAYRVFMKGDEDEKYKYCLTVKNTQVTVENIENEGGLRFKVIAFCYDGGKAVLGKFSESVGAITSPAGVESLYTRSITNDSVTLYWDKAKGATGYRVYIFDEEKDKFVIYTRTPRTTVTVSGLKKDSIYTFKILSYKKINNSVSFGTYSDEHKEYTYNSGAVPHTKAQAAQYYNNHIAKLKAQQNMEVKYKKSIDTEFMSCSKNNLAVSVKNTLNLFEGSLNKTYKYIDGKYDVKSANKLIEPYSKTASLERDDIKMYSAEEKDGSTIVRITLKSENKIYSKGGKNQKSYYDGVLSLPNYKTLKTAPLSIESADSYYSGGSLTLKVTDRKIAVFKVNAAVLSNIIFTVSDVKASTVVGYELNERYEVIYN